MSGGHGGHVDPHNKEIALLIAVLALVLAFSETLGKSAQVDALSYNIEASNLWAFYQSKTIRRTTLRTAAQQTALLADSPQAKERIAEWKKTAERYQNEPDTGEGRDQLEARAKAAEKKRDHARAAYHHFELSSAAVQIGIVLASASIITAISALAWLAGLLGVAGVAFCVIGFWFPTAVHLF
jgi:plasmid stabilization system protein ParE